MTCRKVNEFVEDTPGPGTYNVDVNIGDSAPKYEIGRSKREDNGGFIPNTKNLPGPGTHETLVANKSPKYIIGSGKREQLRINKTPGPGN